MANFGDFKTTNTFGNEWEYEVVPQSGKYCYGVMQADATFTYHPLSFKVEISDLTIWKTCKCYPISEMPRDCEDEPIWTSLGGGGILEGKVHAEVCVPEHPCSRDYPWRDCNHAYLEKCKTATSGARFAFWGNVEAAKTSVEAQMLTCYYDEIGPCKVRAVPQSN